MTHEDGREAIFEIVRIGHTALADARRLALRKLNKALADRPS